MKNRNVENAGQTQWKMSEFVIHFKTTNSWWQTTQDRQRRTRNSCSKFCTRTTVTRRNANDCCFNKLIPTVGATRYSYLSGEPILENDNIFTSAVLALSLSSDFAGDTFLIFVCETSLKKVIIDAVKLQCLKLKAALP